MKKLFNYSVLFSALFVNAMSLINCENVANHQTTFTINNSGNWLKQHYAKHIDRYAEIVKLD